MSRIFDNIDRQLLPVLQETLFVSNRADFCVGVFDRFHVLGHIGKAVDAARKQEHRDLMASGDETLQKIKSMACGFRNIEHFKTAIYFHYGELDLVPC